MYACYKQVSTLSQIDCKLIEKNNSSLRKTLLFGNSLLDSKKSSLYLNISIDYILSTERFEKPFCSNLCEELPPNILL